MVTDSAPIADVELHCCWLKPVGRQVNGKPVCRVEILGWAKRTPDGRFMDVEMEGRAKRYDIEAGRWLA